MQTLMLLQKLNAQGNYTVKIKVIYDKATNGLMFETWDGDKLIYTGSSFEMAKHATIPF